MNSLDLEQQNLEQRKRMAEMLRMQNQQPQGQMVSGHYVAPSALSHLVPIANQLAGKYVGDKADKDMQALGQRRNQSLVEGLRNYAQLAKGTPAETMQPLTPNDDEGNAMPVAQRDAVAGNQQAAAESLLSNENPQLQQLGMQQLIAGLVPKQAKWEKVEMPNPDGSVQTGFVDVNSPRPFETFQAGGTKPVAKKLAPSGQFYNEFTAQEGGALADPNKPFNIGPNGQPVPNQMYQDYTQRTAKAGATTINNKVDVKTGESLAKEVGGIMKEASDAATAASSQVMAAQRISQAIDSNKIFTGPTANVRLQAAQVGDILGITGKDTQEKIANTRNAIQGLAQLTLQGRKQMRGQGAITENESKLAERAISGDISLTPTELKILSNAAERAARYEYANYERKLNALKSNPSTADLAPYYEAQPIPAPLQQQAPASSGFRILGVK